MEDSLSLRGYAHRAHVKWMRTLYSLPEVELDVFGDADPESIDPILEDCCLPPFLGPKTHDDFAALIRILTAVQPKTVVELGTAFGNTVANICNVAVEAKVITVNALPEDQTGDYVTCELTRDEIGRVYRARGFESRVTQVYVNTLDLDLNRHLPSDSVDLAIIDACHDRDYVLNDFFKVRDFMRPGGVVLLHDTHSSMVGHLEGSYMACMTLRRKGYDVRHVAGTWWGVWQRPTNGASARFK